MRAESSEMVPMMLAAQLPRPVPWPNARVQQEAEGQVQERGHALAEAQRPGVA